MGAKEILEKKQIGDVNTVAQIIGSSVEGTRRTLERPNSKMYKRAMTALNDVIIAREELITAGKAERVNN